MNAILDHHDPDYCERCGGECVAGCPEDCDRSCPECEGDAYPIGALGRLRHYRCRRCGWTFDSPIDADPADLR